MAISNITLKMRKDTKRMTDSIFKHNF